MMSDQPFYAPNRKIAPRQPRAGEPLWAIRKHGRQLACELRDDGETGVEVQIYRERELLASRGREVRRYHPHLRLPLTFKCSHGHVQSVVHEMDPIDSLHANGRVSCQSRSRSRPL